METAKNTGKWSRATIIGECMVEMAPTGVANGFSMGFAGDTFNTAWYLAQLCPDAEMAYFTSIGTDKVSDDFVAFAHEAGICMDHAVRCNDRTLGLYVISLEAGERSFSYWRSNSAARTLADDPEALAVALADSDLVYFSGITLAILDDAARDRLLAGIRIVKTGGTLVVFDPNLRPKLWPDADAMTKAVTQAAEVSSIILPSFEDEQIHFGDASPDVTLARYSKAGATSVVVKDGSNAVSYVHHEAVGRVEIEAATDIVDTTAAGDSFNAGFLASLHANADMPTAIARGAGLARHVIGSRGALVPL